MSADEEPDMPAHDATSDQAAVIAHLSDPQSYDPPPSHVERLETHGALIFLAGDYAYKLKRAVRLPYLDFSTVAKREAACRNEMLRNKAAAPGIYIAAEPIGPDANGRLAIGGCDAPIDWVVVMNRFDASCLFDDLARNGRLDKALMVPLAETIAHYHQGAKSCRSDTGDATLAAVIKPVVKSFSDHGEFIDPQRAKALGDRFMAVLDAQAPLLRSRSKDGYVRLCHGDLHLQNIVLWDDSPTLFDAIEFDDRIATVDVLYDLAFLLMDLWHRDLRSHANLCFSSYVARAMTSEGMRGLSALPLFLALRAAIRAMVTIDRLSVAGDTSDAKLSQDIESYFALAEHFLEPPPPTLVAVGGVSGTGKSTLASTLAPSIGGAPGALHLRSDVERKLMAGVDPLDRLPEQSYTSAMSDAVYHRLAERAEAALTAGHSVVVDAVFLTESQRIQIESAGKKLGIPFQGIWLDAQADVLFERVASRRNDASDADVSVVRDQLKTGTNCANWQKVDASGEPGAVEQRARRTIGISSRR